jgi:hypothetical protein
MPTAIKLDCQSGSRTIEIEDVHIDGMLTAEFVTGEIPVPEMPPQNSFVICCLLSERSSAARHRGLVDERQWREGHRREKDTTEVPHLNPLPATGERRTKAHVM